MFIFLCMRVLLKWPQLSLRWVQRSLNRILCNVIRSIPPMVINVASSFRASRTATDLESNSRNGYVLVGSEHLWR